MNDLNSANGMSDIWTKGESWPYKSAIKGSSAENYMKNIKLIDEFFKENIVKNHAMDDNWDTCITVVKKGRAIFQEHLTINKQLRRLCVITNKEISEKDIKNKSVLIFDDSIKTGKTMRSVLRRVFALKPKRITVAAVIAVNKTLKKMDRRYDSKIEFLICKPLFFNVNELNFEIKYKIAHEELVDTYIEYTCRPLQTEDIHPYLLVQLKKNHSSDFLEVFKNHKLLSNNDRGLKKITQNRFKKSFIFKLKEKNAINKYISHIHPGKNAPLLDNRSTVSVRIFYRGDLDELLLQPIIQNYDCENYKHQDQMLFERTDYRVKTFIIYYLIYKYIICASNSKNIEGFSVHLNKVC